MKRKTIIVLGIDRTWDLLFGCCCWGFHGMINSKLIPKQKWYGLHSGHRVLNQRMVTIHNVACLKWPRTRNGPERVRQPCCPKTHIEILASCINQLEGETRKLWWESALVVHGKFCYKGFLRPSAAAHGGKSLSERMWTDALLCPMPKSTYW